MSENGDISSTLELVWLILVHIYALVALLVDDHPNIVQWTQILIILAYVGIIEPSGGFVTPIFTSVPSLAIFILNTSKVV